MAKLQSKVEEVLAIECDCKHSRHSPSNGGDKLVIVARDRGVNLAGEQKIHFKIQKEINFYLVQFSHFSTCVAINLHPFSPSTPLVLPNPNLPPPGPVFSENLKL